jgi:hypothetical protein
MRINDSSERVWSEGLDDEAATQARKEVKEVWVSFNVALTEWLERIEGSSALAGLTTTSEQYPLDDTGLSRLELDAVDAPSAGAASYRLLFSTP